MLETTMCTSANKLSRDLQLCSRYGTVQHTSRAASVSPVMMQRDDNDASEFTDANMMAGSGMSAAAASSDNNDDGSGTNGDGGGAVDLSAMRQRLGMFLQMHAQRAELQAAARGIAPAIKKMRGEIGALMRAHSLDVLDYTVPFHAEVRAVVRRVTKRATLDDALALVEHRHGAAARQQIVADLKALANASVETRHDVRVCFKRGEQFAQQRHQAVVDQFVPIQMS